MTITLDPTIEHATAVSSGYGYEDGHTPECECGWAESACSTEAEAIERVDQHLAMVAFDEAKWDYSCAPPATIAHALRANAIAMTDGDWGTHRVEQLEAIAAEMRYRWNASRC